MAKIRRRRPPRPTNLAPATQLDHAAVAEEIEAQRAEAVAAAGGDEASRRSRNRQPKAWIRRRSWPSGRKPPLP